MIVVLFIAVSVVCGLYIHENVKVSVRDQKIKSYEDSISVYQKELKMLKLEKDSLNISLAESLEELEEKKTQIKTLKKKLYAKADSVKLLPNDKSVEYLSKFLSKRGKAGE
jgi:cupin superfamily acireductone dioxygenase involved in methionine salvage